MVLQVILRTQFASLKNLKRGEHSKYLPFVFTEQGVVMLASLNNKPKNKIGYLANKNDDE